MAFRLANVDGRAVLVHGDLILTGAPDGVSGSQGNFFADGDVTLSEIDGGGTMTNRVVRIADAPPISR